MKLSRYLWFFFSAMLALAGCGGSSTSTPPPPAIGQIYVTTANKDEVSRFKAGDNGNVSPQGQLRVQFNAPTFIAMDVPHDRIAIKSSDVNTPAITLIDNASSILSPLTAPRTITGAATTLGTKMGLCALDSARDLLYVAQDLGAGTGVVLVFGPASTINGDVAPLRTFTLPFHPFGLVVEVPSGLVLDVANDSLFLSDPVTNAITIFDKTSTLTGSVVPSRTITGANTQLNIPGPMVLDSSGRLIVSINSGSINSQVFGILVFQNAATANGNIVPSASSTISQPPTEMAISPAGELYVVDGSPHITVYGGVATATGVINPIRVIAGPNTGLDPFFGNIPALPLGIAVDPTR
jgi:hypothetical protein